MAAAGLYMNGTLKRMPPPGIKLPPLGKLKSARVKNRGGNSTKIYRHLDFGIFFFYNVLG